MLPVGFGPVSTSMTSSDMRRAYEFGAADVKRAVCRVLRELVSRDAGSYPTLQAG
jgi:hypothetical protein